MDYQFKTRLLNKQLVGFQNCFCVLSRQLCQRRVKRAEHIESRTDRTINEIQCEFILKLDWRNGILVNKHQALFYVLVAVNQNVRKSKIISPIKNCVKLKMKQRKLRSGVNWERGV